MENNNPKNIKIFLVCILIIFVLGVSTVVANVTKSNLTGTPLTIINKEDPVEVKYCKEEAELNLLAESFVIYNKSDDCIVYSKNEEEKRPVASLQKLMTAIVADEIIPDGAPIQITYEDLAMPDDHGLVAGDLWKKEDLISLLLVTSSNDIAHALRRTSEEYHLGEDESFVAIMNQRAIEIGMEHTVFFNETGLDESSVFPGAYSTALDMVKLAKYSLIKISDYIYKTSQPTISVGPIGKPNLVFKNTNYITEKYPSLLFSKTGLTNLAGGNLIIAFETGPLEEYIAVILGSTKEGRFIDSLDIINFLLYKV